MNAVQLDADWVPDLKPSRNLNTPADFAESRKSGAWRTPRLRLVDLPEPHLGPDDAIIKPLVAGIGDADRQFIKGDDHGYLTSAHGARLPRVPGQAFAGKIESVGDQVINVRPGDYVTAEAFQWCGECAACRTTRYVFCESPEELGRTIDGAYAERIRLVSKFCWPINYLIEEFGVRKGCEMGAMVLPLARVYNAMFVRAGGILPGECVGIYGSGLLSLAAIALARAAGAGQIVVFGDSPTVPPLARKLGATIAYGTADLAALELRPHQIVMEATQGQGASIQMDTNGNAGGLMSELEGSLALMGRIVTLVSQPEAADIDLEQFIFRQARLQPVQGHVGHSIFPNLIELMRTGAVDITPAIIGRVRLSEVPPLITGSGSSGEQLRRGHWVMSEIDNEVV